MIKLRARDGRNPKDLAAMDLAGHLDDRVRKTKYVRTMFDVIAPGYDMFTRFFSFGMDSRWKSILIAEAAKRTRERAVVVDLACGTGDFGIALAQAVDAQLAIGLDLSPQMLIEAKRRVEVSESKLVLAVCDMLSLCLRDRSVDVVTVGYGLRNTADVSLALREIARVLRPGGILVNLDFHRPRGAFRRELFLWYMWNAGRVAGWLWHREPSTYGYLAPSIRRYLTIPEFEQELARAGFQVGWRASRLGGAIGMHIATRVELSH